MTTIISPPDGMHVLTPDLLTPHIHPGPIVVVIDGGLMTPDDFPAVEEGRAWRGGAPGYPLGYGTANPHAGGWLIYRFYADGTYEIFESLSNNVVEQGTWN